MCRHAWIVVPLTAVSMLVAAEPLSAADPARIAMAVPPLGWLATTPPADGDSADDAARPDARTPYIAAMIGSSFAAGDSGGLGGTLLTGEGALGVSLPRPAGAVRLEIEGRQRAALSGPRPGAGDADGQAVAEISGEWTTMANVWRDVSVAEHLSLYAGGGVGVGGYTHDPDAAGPETAGRLTAFGWQAGGGVAYAVTDRLTLDAGCRLYGLEAGGGRAAAGPPAAEILFAVRIADPFRGWLRR
jgi:opacity protein-like surface antigen